MVRRRSQVLGYAATALVSCILAGCGGSNNPATAKVSGVVTYKGAPVGDAVVTFMPTSGRPASGQTDAAGKFTLSTFGNNDGAVLGDHKISITPYLKDVPMPETVEAAAALPKLPFPARYANPDTSTLTAKVDSGANEKNFELTD
ncbi:MAG: hypothetical protein ABI614_22400 [Planctomycetota bacterium]